MPFVKIIDPVKRNRIEDLLFSPLEYMQNQNLVVFMYLSKAIYQISNQEKILKTFIKHCL